MPVDVSRKIDFTDNQSFALLHSALWSFVEEHGWPSVVRFDVNDKIPKELQGREFTFNAAEGAHPERGPAIGIMVEEQLDEESVPFMTVYAVKDKPGNNVAVTFTSKKVLSSNHVNILLMSVKAAIENYPGEEKVNQHVTVH
jgi:hypothetical protein